MALAAPELATIIAVAVGEDNLLSRVAIGIDDESAFSRLQSWRGNRMRPSLGAAMQRTSKTNPHNSKPDDRIISSPILEGCGHELGLCV